MSPLYPALLDLHRAGVLVVGGGPVALRKTRTLVECGGRPRVVAPELVPELDALVRDEGLEWSAREYRSGDARGCRVVVAATDRAEVNAQVARDAVEVGAWVNVADDPDASTFQVPAAIRQGELTVAFSTGGASPLLARRLRERLESVATPGLGRAVARLGRLRQEVHARWPADEERRRRFWDSLVTDAFLDDAISGQDERLEARIETCLSQS